MRTIALTLLISLALASPALAQGPAQDGYTAAGPQAVEQTGASAGRSEQDRAGHGGALPFTGMDLLLVAGFGLAMLGLGMGMRALTRPTAPAGAHPAVTLRARRGAPRVASQRWPTA